MELLPEYLSSSKTTLLDFLRYQANKTGWGATYQAQGSFTPTHYS